MLMFCFNKGLIFVPPVLWCTIKTMSRFLWHWYHIYFLVNTPHWSELIWSSSGSTNPCFCKAESRARQNGDHSDHWSQKVLIFDGKFYLSFMRFCLLFDGKRVSVTETNILLLTICMILTMIRISILKTKYIWFHFPDFKDFALFVANFVVVIYALSRKV